MRGFFGEHKLLILSGIIIVAFFGFAFSQKSVSIPSSPEEATMFRTANTEGSMFKGPKDATTTIIQYSDFLCPSCSLFSTQVMPSIDENYIATDKVNFEFRPMAFIADGSVQAGMGGYCAVDQNKFWPYHDSIYKFVAYEVFNNGKDPKSDVILTASLVKNIAKSSGLDSQSFDTCLDSNKHLTDIQTATTTANQNGVTGTPYIMVDGEVYQGNMTLTAFEALVKAKL